MIHQAELLTQIFETIITSTACNSNSLLQFETKRLHQSVCMVLSNLTNALEIEDTVANYALILLKKLSDQDVCITNSQIFKYLTT